MRILDVKEMKIAGYSNPNRNTGGRSMQEYEAGASWTMKQLATAMEEYGEDVGSPRNKEGYVLLMYFSPSQAVHSRQKRQLSSGLNRIYLGLTVMIVMMQIMNRKCASLCDTV